ncbi:uncharacterized protein BDZ99DRAFT_428822 [Mytilinidion resinicola]|uniref:Uncharacterized protein n=1 Tax=Mytilinidion resinicola TaxID=574789 RepID=A0A6A6Y0Y9_9PEZI|nr:uncharacterized protein BDZ99DRAFT_428822 [Mytilinidion resinicola]KAF2802309.1 hypothetical protein BDZ99DRAFT_428822 [Mytilinidion resinicola]
MDRGTRNDSSAKKLTPLVSKTNPLDPAASTLHNRRALYPAITFKGGKVLRPNREPWTSLALELKTPRLNDIHQHLWLAGLPAAARPLHRQKLLGRNILVTEDPDEHLVWFELDIFIKPLPDFLLDWNFWNDSLCLDQGLHEAACGLLLSYAWLVRHKSDLDIAKELGLLSKNMEWSKWVEFIDTFLDNINCETMSDVNKRYKYGELRLSRLNAIYRLAPPTYSLRNLVRGYQSGSTWYRAFFERHFKWILAGFAIVSVLLSALQVGLATSMLQSNGSFQSASYGFTIAYLVAVVTSVIVVFLVWLGLFCYHLLVTWRNDRAVNCRRLAGVSFP